MIPFDDISYTEYYGWNAAPASDTFPPEWCAFYGVTCDMDYGSASLYSVTSIELSSKGLQGTLPNSIGSLTSLLHLAFGGNYLTGTIPSSIGSMSSLTQLTLNNNLLTGSIPSSISSLTQLVIIYMDNNQLTGTIPSLSLLNSLYRLLLTGNYLTGSVSDSLFPDSLYYPTSDFELDGNCLSLGYETGTHCQPPSSKFQN